MTKPTLDFSTRTDSDLVSALRSIDRDKFEANYRACLSEIQRRKADGRWTISVESERAKVDKASRWLWYGALFQFIGALYGLALTIYSAIAYLSRRVDAAALLYLITLAAYSVAACVTWKFLKSKRDENGYWRTLLYFQVPAFSLGGFTYQFVSGPQVSLGLNGDRFGLNAILGSEMSLRWDANAPPSTLTLNLLAIALLVLLSRTERPSPASAES